MLMIESVHRRNTHSHVQQGGSGGQGSGHSRLVAVGHWGSAVGRRGHLGLGVVCGVGLWYGLLGLGLWAGLGEFLTLETLVLVTHLLIVWIMLINKIGHLFSHMNFWRMFLPLSPLLICLPIRHTLGSEPISRRIARITIRVPIVRHGRWRSNMSAILRRMRCHSFALISILLLSLLLLPFLFGDRWAWGPNHHFLNNIILLRPRLLINYRNMPGVFCFS